MTDVLGQPLFELDFILITYNNYLIPALIVEVNHNSVHYVTTSTTARSSIRMYDHISKLDEGLVHSAAANEPYSRMKSLCASIIELKRQLIKNKS